MKRLLVYFSVLVGCLFIGLTTYYLVKNYEIINVQAADSSLDAIYLNVGEETNLEITHELKKTELSYTLSDDTLVSFDVETGKIVALEAGETKLTVTTENKKYGPYEFTVKIGNGQEGTPYCIQNEDDLQAIGGTRVYSSEVSKVWSPSANYLIVKDIEVTKEFAPLCQEESFTGTLQGGLNKIINLKITEDQESAGLFSQIGSLATVESIIFENPTIEGRFDFAGVLAGASWASTISKINVVNAKINVAPYSADEDGVSTSMTGGIVGATVGEVLDSSATNPLYDRGIITMCSFQGTIGTHETINSVVSSTTASILSKGGIAGYVLGSTIHNTKADVEFEIDETAAGQSKQFVRNNNATGVCIDLGGIVGSIAEKLSILDDEKTQGRLYPIIQNNLAIVNANTKTTSTRGVIGHIPSDVQTTSGQQWVIGNYYFNDNETITEGGSIKDSATTKIASETELKNQSTYVSMGNETWEIGDVLSPWAMNENEAPSINFDGMETPVRFNEEVYKITTKEEFKEFYEKMTNEDLGLTVNRYWLRQNYVLETDINFAELGLEEFVAIGGGKYGFTGTFDGNGKTITLTAEANLGQQALTFAGLFGQVNATAEIKNLTVVGISINEATYAGGLAALNLGKITNCVVKDVKINNATYAGGLVGVNYGIITGNVETESIGVTDLAFVNTIEIKHTNKKVFAGAITAINHGTITGIAIPGTFKIAGTETSADEATKIFGGLVGYNTGLLEDSYVTNINITDYSTSKAYLGAIVGINAGKVVKATAGGENGGISANIVASINDGKQLAGGIAGVITPAGEVKQSFVNVNIKARTVAGFAPYLFGTVSECYSVGVIEGHEVGGFAVYMAQNDKGGHVYNCYTTLNLGGTEEKSKVAGLVVYMEHPAVIEKCYMAATFTSGKMYYESFTNTREGLVNWISSWANKDNRLGTITNVVINTHKNSDGTGGNENVKETNAIISYNNQVVKYLTEDECKAGKTVFEALGFTISPTSGWTIEIDENPILTTVEGLHGISQNPSTEDDGMLDDGLGGEE